MMHLIFTLDYEIYGNGEGDLGDLVYEPTSRLASLFDEYGWKFVNFVEAAELNQISKEKSHERIHDVETQISDLYARGHEIGLHIHPQWFDARYENGKWALNYGEYNLCTLPEEKIRSYIGNSISYLKGIVSHEGYSPVSYRAGNWLMQPSVSISRVLVQSGIMVDSSVFKGGVLRSHNLDYRPSLKNGYWWRFHEDINEPDTAGKLVEIPIFTRMVPPWKMYSAKRGTIRRQRSLRKGNKGQRFYKIRDMFRLLYPQKFDFAKLTLNELKAMLNYLIDMDDRTPEIYKPIVLIAHSKNLSDFDTLRSFFEYIRERRFEVLTFKQIVERGILVNSE